MIVSVVLIIRQRFFSYSLSLSLFLSLSLSLSLSRARVSIVCRSSVLKRENPEKFHRQLDERHARLEVTQDRQFPPFAAKFRILFQRQNRTRTNPDERSVRVAQTAVGLVHRFNPPASRIDSDIIVPLIIRSRRGIYRYEFPSIIFHEHTICIHTWRFSHVHYAFASRVESVCPKSGMKITSGPQDSLDDHDSCQTSFETLAVKYRDRVFLRCLAVGTAITGSRFNIYRTVGRHKRSR